MRRWFRCTACEEFTSMFLITRRAYLEITACTLVVAHAYLQMITTEAGLLHLMATHG